MEINEISIWDIGIQDTMGIGNGWVWIRSKMGMERVNGSYQLLIKRRKDGTVELMMVKKTEDLLFAGDKNRMGIFVSYISERFNICKSVINALINLNRIMIEQDNIGNIKMSMDT